MTFTYNVEKLRDPEVGPLMRVRFALGDTDDDNQHIQDEEIEALLILNGNKEKRVIVEAADHIAMSFSKAATFSVGQYKEDLEARAQAWRDIAKDLRKRHGYSGVPMPMASQASYFEGVQLDGARANDWRFQDD